MKIILKMENQGISLVSLIITIIILIILAGISISMILGNEGLLNKTKYATESYSNAQRQEKLQISKLSNEINSKVDGSRNTITLTEEEYNIFKGFYSKNNGKDTVSIIKPNTWEVGTEYDFGDGLYGQRFTGTMTMTANSATTEQLNANNINKIVDQGGNLLWNNGNNHAAFVTDYGNWGSVLFVDNSDGNKLRIRVRVATASSCTYDIWVIYTKL